MPHALAKKTHVNRLRDLDGNQARLHYTWVNKNKVWLQQSDMR